MLGASSYCKTETTDKFDRWAAATVEIYLRPVTVYYSRNFWRYLLQIDFAAKPRDSIECTVDVYFLGYQEFCSFCFLISFSLLWLPLFDNFAMYD